MPSLTVIDVARQPSHVRGALSRLGDRAASWVFVSSASVYAAHDRPGAEEDDALLPAHDGDIEGQEAYGERKGISYATWREAGVSPAVLKQAGISRSK